ncbi:MAG TPA: transaldolase [Acidimicrobiales bacterium]|nr:transaldolase [Acidimicrobiales bacterium]
MTRLHDLYDQAGQSPWLDNLRRDWLVSGRLADLVAQGVRGVTSNPTIFAKAIEGQDTYDEQFRSLVPTSTVEAAYWELVVRDITDALGVLAPVHQASGGGDGFVSLEVAPALAHDTSSTVEAARTLHDRINRPNLLVKVPATAEGVAAIRTLIGEGRSINVTLIFGLERYDEVMEAYLSGLEAYAAAGASDLSGVASVASFFVSRVDTEVDRRLEQLAGGPDGDKDVLALRGRAAVAQAQVAYQHFVSTFAGPRWAALAARGARVQRPLWASTSTKNPAYSDLLYVDSLIGPDTVNTMPDGTLDAFSDHGTVARTVDADPAGAEATLGRLTDAGIDFADVAETLEDEGVHSFVKSFDELIQVLTDKAATFGAGPVTETEKR